MSCFRMQRAFVFGLAFFVWATLPIFHVGIDVRAQQSNAAALASDEREKAIKLYTAGETKKAVEALRAVVKKRKDDADAWYYLGLALNRNADAKNARKAFETSIKLRPNFANAHTGFAYTLLLANKLNDAVREAEQALRLDAQNAEAHYIISVVRLREHASSKALAEADAALRVNANFAPALLVKSQALLNEIGERHAAASTNNTQTQTTPLSADERKERRLKQATRYAEAAKSLEAFLKLTPDAANAETWREQLQALHIYAEAADKPEAERTIFSPDEVTTKAQILKKPEAQYTEAARQNDVNGAVLLRVVLAADGTVKHILALQSLSNGLTEQTIKAVRQIKFIPATKDNHPVSTSVMIEYEFHLY